MLALAMAMLPYGPVCPSGQAGVWHSASHHLQRGPRPQNAWLRWRLFDGLVWASRSPPGRARLSDNRPAAPGARIATKSPEVAGPGHTQTDFGVRMPYTEYAV